MDATRAGGGEPEDLRGRTLHRVYALGTDNGRIAGLDGTGVVAVVNDDGFVGCIDFTGRTEQSDVAGDMSRDHGDMVAGISAETGKLDPGSGAWRQVPTIIRPKYSGNMPQHGGPVPDEGAVIFSSGYSNGCNVGYTSTTQLVDDEIYVTIRRSSRCSPPGTAAPATAGSGRATSGATSPAGAQTREERRIGHAANLNDIDILWQQQPGPSTDGRTRPTSAPMGTARPAPRPAPTARAAAPDAAAPRRVRRVGRAVPRLARTAWRRCNSGLIESLSAERRRRPGEHRAGFPASAGDA